MAWREEGIIAGFSYRNMKLLLLDRKDTNTHAATVIKQIESHWAPQQNILVLFMDESNFFAKLMKGDYIDTFVESMQKEKLLSTVWLHDIEKTTTNNLEHLRESLKRTHICVMNGNMCCTFEHNFDCSIIVELAVCKHTQLTRA